MALVLHDWGPSPFCLKVRAILDHKRLTYVRRPLGPVSLARIARRGRIGKVPALELDGRMIVDSTDIALALEDLAPEPSILPRDPRDRALCHLLEDQADESLYWFGLYFQWWDPEGARLAPKAFRGPMRLLLGPVRRRVLGQIRGQGTGRKPREHVLADLERNLDAYVALLDAPCLFGEAPMLADFALAAQLVYLDRTPGGHGPIARRQRLVAYLEHMRGFRAGA